MNQQCSVNMLDLVKAPLPYDCVDIIDEIGHGIFAPVKNNDPFFNHLMFQCPN